MKICIVMQLSIVCGLVTTSVVRACTTVNSAQNYIQRQTELDLERYRWQRDVSIHYVYQEIELEGGILGVVGTKKPRCALADHIWEAVSPSDPDNKGPHKSHLGPMEARCIKCGYEPWKDTAGVPNG